MESVVDTLTNKRIEEWYKENTKPGFLDQVVKDNKSNGYVLDKDSGLLIKQLHTPEELEELGYTERDIIFPRPTDYHFHPDVDETLTLLSGKGFSFEGELYDLSKSPPTLVCFGGLVKKTVIPKEIKHMIIPKKGTTLELHLECSGILDPEKEELVRHFDVAYPKVLNHYKGIIF
ncbi:MAG: hypothetical protein JSW73_04080 [Candidatus Woesearchaeota archaeon]|nr:MAG: hypothetical protein JSW73_04080 [Candidatus Woesearchaeota archaeon]